MIQVKYVVAQLPILSIILLHVFNYILNYFINIFSLIISITTKIANNWQDRSNREHYYIISLNQAYAYEYLNSRIVNIYDSVTSLGNGQILLYDSSVSLYVRLDSNSAKSSYSSTSGFTLIYSGGWING